MTAQAPARRVPRITGDRWDVIVDLLGEPGSVLDVGCRDRALRGHLAPDVEYVGVDLFPPADVIASAEEPLPFDDDSFDCVVLADVLEHLEHPHRALDEAMRTARHAVVLLLPNLYALRHRFEFATGRTWSKYEFGPEHLLDRHRWVLNLDQAASFARGRAERCGWQVAREYGYDGGPRHPATRLLTRLARATARPNLWAWLYAARLEPR